MATIRFQILNNSDSTASTDTLSGSGLAFFGANGGSSVAIGQYQDSTWVSNGDGTSYTTATLNNKFIDDGEFPSGRVELGGAFGGDDTTLSLTGIKSMHATLGIEFGHSTEINVQNCQLRVYDRANPNNPASGVNTKVAEIVNFNGAANSVSQGSTSQTSAAVGSGDCWWWGEAWPDAECNGTNFYTNSVGTVFYNGTDAASRTNGDARLATAAVAGSYDTVGGTGIIVPLLDSPGSGQRGLHNAQEVSGTGMVWPKCTQYAQGSSFQTAVLGGSFGNGADTSKVAGIAPIDRTYGGTGVDTHHTWAVALSASPLSSGGKENYGMYVSLEYY